MASGLDFITIAEAARLLAARKLSPVELTTAKLERIAALDPQLNAFVTLTADRALEQARRAEEEIASGSRRGAMHGIPYAVKDVYKTAGIPTTAQSRICRDYVPDEDATAVARLQSAGAVLLGKLTTHEFAHGGPSFDLPWPPARNPWDRARFTGGSSSGSASAVAAGFAPGTLGTDTGGSVRIPAALCGVTGLKPTYGLVSRRGVIPNSFTFDHCGPLAWTAEDCAIVLQSMAGHDPLDPASSDAPVAEYRDRLDGDVRSMRVGVLRHFWEEDLEVGNAVSRAMEAAIDVLARLGCRIETVRMRPLQEYTDVKNLISEAELFAVHQRDLAVRAGDFGEIMRRRIFAFCLFQAADYVQAQRQRRRMLAEMKPLYDKYDVFLNAAPGPAAPLASSREIGLQDKWDKPKLPAAFSVCGGPALVVCNGFDEQGLPLAMEIAGRPFDEPGVLRVGHAYQQATPWRAQRPRLVPGDCAPAIVQSAAPGPATALDDRIRMHVDMMAERAGLKLTPSQRQELYDAAPHALALASRIRRDHAWEDEPADIFRFD